MKVGMINNLEECKRCVMDASDIELVLDENGICNYCLEFDKVTSKKWFPNEVGAKKLQALYEEIKKQSKGGYDCIIGLSGGVDSSYLALKLFEAGLKPLVVHVDGGWNRELAVNNIENIVNYCGWDLHTVVVDWDEMRDLQLSFLKSSVSNQDVPQDHAFFASLYHFATKHKIKYIVSGGNIATESIFPRSWLWSAMDADNLKSIHRKFGERKLKKYKTISFFQLYFYYPFVKKMKTVRPLNFMPYNKREALQELKSKVAYKEYDRKHGESIFTKFYQDYWLPMKFEYDKRRPHLSSLIMSGQITRDEAVLELEKPLYSEKELVEDKQYIAKKLGLTNEEFHNILNMQKHHYRDFSNMKKNMK